MDLNDLTRRKCACIKVPKIHGEEVIRLANKLKIVNKKLKINRDKSFIYVPLLRQPSQDESNIIKKKAPDSKLAEDAFVEKKMRAVTLLEALEKNLPPELLTSLPRAIDFVGDIAVIEISQELQAYKNVLGEAILNAHKNVQTVLLKESAVRGAYRLREFSVIAGEARTDTIHREYGCRYRVDLAKAYFSPRLSYEHKRVSSLVKEGETVVDLFAGVGPFAILIAKTHVNVKVHAIDLNPYAFELLKENIRLNRVVSRVYPLSGDAKQVVQQGLTKVADRVIMNLPERAIEFVDAGCEALKSTGGIMHFYSFAEASESVKNLKRRFIAAVEESGRKVKKIPVSRRVRATAPYMWQFVLDGEIR